MRPSFCLWALGGGWYELDQGAGWSALPTFLGGAPFTSLPAPRAVDAASSTRGPTPPLASTALLTTRAPLCLLPSFLPSSRSVQTSPPVGSIAASPRCPPRFSEAPS